MEVAGSPSAGYAQPCQPIQAAGHCQALKKARTLYTNAR